jgi:hypothetical protein
MAAAFECELERTSALEVIVDEEYGRHDKGQF